MSLDIKGRIILNEVHLSISVIKNILYNDIFESSQEETKEEYIKNLIKRLDNIKTDI